MCTAHSAVNEHKVSIGGATKTPPQGEAMSCSHKAWFISNKETVGRCGSLNKLPPHKAVCQFYSNGKRGVQDVRKGVGRPFLLQPQATSHTLAQRAGSHSPPCQGGLAPSAHTVLGKGSWEVPGKASSSVEALYLGLQHLGLALSDIRAMIFLTSSKVVLRRTFQPLNKVISQVLKSLFVHLQTTHADRIIGNVPLYQGKKAGDYHHSPDVSSSHFHLYIT